MARLLLLLLLKQVRAQKVGLAEQLGRALGATELRAGQVEASGQLSVMVMIMLELALTLLRLQMVAAIVRIRARATWSGWRGSVCGAACGDARRGGGRGAGANWRGRRQPKLGRLHVQAKLVLLEVSMSAAELLLLLAESVVLALLVVQWSG